MTSRRRAMLLTELLVALVLISAFTIVTGRLFFAMFDVADEARDIPIKDRRTQHVLEQLRQDVWEAADIKPASDRGIECLYFDRREIIWTIESDTDPAAIKRVVRHDARIVDEASWTLDVLPSKFAWKDRALHVHWPEDSERTEDVTVFDSQHAILIGGEAP